MPEQPLTDLAIRRALAEALGWADLHHGGGAKLWGRPASGERARAVPDWPQDLNAAFQLVELLREREVKWEFHTVLGSQWHVGLHHRLRGKTESVEIHWAENLARGISEAALAALRNSNA